MTRDHLSSADAQRLAKVVAARVPCSRREAEQYIEQGWVRVDGQRVDQPQVRVTPGQAVEIDPRARLQPTVAATFLIHKPAGMDEDAVVGLLDGSTRWSEDPSGVVRSKAHHSGLKALLTLPAQAGGLNIYSQDFRVVRKLTEEAALVEQELVAEVDGAIEPDGLARLCHGLVREGWPLPPAKVSWQSEKRLRFAAKGIDPAWIGWMCAQVGLELRALRRLRVGRIALAGLPAGQWRYLSVGERF